MSVATRELQWLSFLLSDLHQHFTSPIPLFCDNQAALYIVKNPVFHERTKHIEIDFHVVRNLYKQGLLFPQKIASHQQIADVFTKSLPRQQFQKFCFKLRLSDISKP